LPLSNQETDLLRQPERIAVPGDIPLALEIHREKSANPPARPSDERRFFLESLASLIGQLVNQWSEIEEQRKAHRLLSGVFEAVSEAVFAVGLPERTILNCNPAVERIFGATNIPGEPIDASFFLAKPFSPETLTKKVREVLDG
jgi:PAS domain-containing protein